jgi:hypothetical protein
MKQILILTFLTLLVSCTPRDLQNVLDAVTGAELTSAEVAGGLKEALNQGISKGVDILSQKDGYFKSQYKILLPEEARKVTDKLQNIPGFTDVENVILEKINRGAEDAAKKATPIFVSAIKAMTFNDAMNILMGEDNAATVYLQGTTTQQLYQEFNPVIVESLDKFNARQYWADAINAYNKLPFVEKVNPSLDDYVTNEALDGLFNMVQKEEKNIRENVSARTTELMRRVFAKQDQ